MNDAADRDELTCFTGLLTVGAVVRLTPSGIDMLSIADAVVSPDSPGTDVTDKYQLHEQMPAVFNDVASCYIPQ